MVRRWLLGIGLAAAWMAAAQALAVRQLAELSNAENYQGQNMLAFSPDGKMLVSTTSDRNLKVWDVRTRALQTTQPAHAIEVNAVAVSPDNATGATGGCDKEEGGFCRAGSVKFWDLKKGELLFSGKGHTAAVYSVAYYPDGKTLASAGGDNTVRLWDTATGKLLQTLKGHEGLVHCVAVSPDAGVLVSASIDNTIRFWDPATGKLTTTYKFKEPHWDPNAIAFSPRGTMMAVAGCGKFQQPDGCSAGGIKLWDSSGSLLRSLSGHHDLIHSLAFSPDGALLASGSRDGTILLWQLRAQSTPISFKAHKSNVLSLAFAPAGYLLASAGYDALIHFWDIQQNDPDS